jgi:hypothetical protein
MWRAVPQTESFVNDITNKRLLDAIEFENAPFGNSHTKNAVATFGAFQTITSALLVVAFFRSFGPLIVQQRWRSRALRVRYGHCPVFSSSPLPSPSFSYS